MNCRFVPLIVLSAGLEMRAQGRSGPYRTLWDADRTGDTGLCAAGLTTTQRFHPDFFATLTRWARTL
jgi:hypothetical protein